MQTHIHAQCPPPPPPSSALFLDSSSHNRKWGRHSCALYVERDNDNFISCCTSHNWQPITALFLSPCPLRHIKCTLLPLGPLHTRTPYQRLVVNLLSDELVFAEWVTCLSRNGVNGPFFHLLLDGTKEGEERLTCTFLQRHVKREEQWEERKRWSHFGTRLTTTFNIVWENICLQLCRMLDSTFAEQDL